MVIGIIIPLHYLVSDQRSGSKKFFFNSLLNVQTKYFLSKADTVCAQ